ncbi:MAG: adenylate/guanylate cyclase domain-containing protein [Tabrizicola sp.]|nr:adenylate/guanylate cyclase domain-containing protein [Tabrizicola sp.]
METARQVRRLAAVLVSDVVGYSRLMAEDEDAALAALNRHLETEFNPTVGQHNGRLVKLLGDGALVEFASVVDAVDCAIAVQSAAVVSQSPITLRIGINLGDIILQGDDIFGDGVNIAARLEPIAEPGGICISSVAHESLRGRVGATFADGGEVHVKNIDRPVRVWYWHPRDAADRPRAVAAASERRIEGPSIAVLAFDNMSGDPEQAYFSDGIAEDIITDLSKVSGLTVIARNSSFAYKGRSVDVRSIGRELGVAYVLEGSVRRMGQRVRVTAQLIDAATGSHLWANRYDGDLTDVFAVQDEVTLKIVEALKVRLSPAEEASIARVGSTNGAAHDAFLQMRNLFFSPVVNAESWARALEHGDRAIELDPDYAQALSLMAMAYSMGILNGWSTENTDVLVARATALAERAVSIGPEEPLSNIAFAIASRLRGDFDTAVRACRKAVSLSPDSGHALSNLAANLIATGNPAEALPLLERAIRLDPGWSQQYMQFLGQAHFLLQNFETAALLFRERLYLARDTDIGRGWLAATLGHLGEIDQAQAVWAELMAIKPDFRMASRLARFGYQRAQDPAFVLEGLVKANLPTGE